MHERNSRAFVAFSKSTNRMGSQPVHAYIKYLTAQASFSHFFHHCFITLFTLLVPSCITTRII